MIITTDSVDYQNLLLLKQREALELMRVNLDLVYSNEVYSKSNGTIIGLSAGFKLLSESGELHIRMKVDKVDEGTINIGLKILKSIGLSDILTNTKLLAMKINRLIPINLSEGKVYNINITS